MREEIKGEKRRVWKKKRVNFYVKINEIKNAYFFLYTNGFTCI
jgi:hypothetical protein